MVMCHCKGARKPCEPMTDEEDTNMLSRENATFNEINRAGYEWEKARRERRERKERIIETYGWDSEELKAWYAEEEAASFPYPSGACKALRAWEDSIRRQEDEIEMSDHLWDKEVADFLDTLCQAGFRTFVYTNQSTAVMENIHAFAAHGWTMEGLCTITRIEDRWGEDKPVETLGIRFRLD